jgi:DNA-binding NtrC family response regulator
MVSSPAIVPDPLRPQSTELVDPATLPDPSRTQSTPLVEPASHASVKEVLHLVVAWSSDQPELVGHVAPVEAARVLGRGPLQPDDPAQRLLFGGHRPSQLEWAPPFTGAQLSRRQLLFTPGPDGTLSVTQMGRCPLRINGAVVQSGTVRPGDTVALQETLLLLVVARPAQWFLAPGLGRDVAFPFGAADAHGIIGESPAAWALRGAVAFAAKSSHHVLVHGESGSGKELAARAIHALSPRSRGPFVARNAATLPEGLVDAELFGNVRGYPHAASPERPGLIGEAHGGTLFLDEIGELRHDLQAHLLRVLDHGGEYQRLGEGRPRRSDLRLVAATNRPPDALKHDLAARFALLLRVPGLNERREDIPLLLRHLLAAAARDHPDVAARYLERRGKRLDTAVVDPYFVEALLHHELTHHFRELNRLLWVALSSGRHSYVGLTAELRAELHKQPERAPEPPVRGPSRLTGNEPGETGPAQKPNIERADIEAALARTGGKIAPAARLLGLKNRHILSRLMVRHGIGADEGEDSKADG